MMKVTVSAPDEVTRITAALAVGAISTRRPKLSNSTEYR
jgi:hypothetical protein